MERRRLWWRWLVHVTAGEVCGFFAPAITAVALAGVGDAARIAPLACAGAVEGAVLGVAQARVLQPHLAGFDRRRWWLATALAAALAWTLGMLPAATYPAWADWPVPVIGVAGAVGGVVLICSIGVAQAWVLPGRTFRWSWVGWSVAGWGAGLGAFFAVAPPWWHEGQSAEAVFAIGVVAALVMAAVMAAITGLGAVRLVAHPPVPPATAGDPVHLLSAALGGPVRGVDGRPLGTITDLVVDVSTDRSPVTGLVVERPGDDLDGRLLRGVVDAAAGTWVLTADQHAAEPLRPTEVLLARDVLDAPVVMTIAPHERRRVSDVVLEQVPSGTAVAGLDLSPRGVADRLLGRSPSDRAATVRMSEVHLGSLRGHAAQLATDDGPARRWEAGALAEVLTRTSLTHAREILAAADEEVGRRAVALVHPALRDRITGHSGPARRMLRSRGWRLHRPSDSHRSLR